MAQTTEGSDRTRTSWVSQELSFKEMSLMTSILRIGDGTNNRKVARNAPARTVKDRSLRMGDPAR